MKNHIGQNVLVTCSNWFIAPNGKEYKAVWGKLIAIHEAGKELGFIPNRSHANWFIEIGTMQIMGCQVMYFIGCPDKPNTEITSSWNSKSEGGIVQYERPTMIYEAV